MLNHYILWCFDILTLFNTMLALTIFGKFDNFRFCVKALTICLILCTIFVNYLTFVV